MKITSKKPGKQRKALSNYSIHHRSKLLSTRVADFIRDEYGIKRLPLRVGDHVRVCKGEFKDFEGEVLEITKDLRCKIKEAQFEKTDGTQYHPPIHVSNLIITKFTEEKKMDPWRASMIERKALYGFYEQELTGPKKQKEGEK
jgi:large subunit ribosomal protein L24